MHILTLLVGLFGIAGVALGAAGAHGLHVQLAERGMTATWQTAVLYHLVHTVAALAVTRQNASATSPGYWRGVAGLWLTGVLLFSGSLYALSLGGPRWLGPVTPVGGLAFIIGWAGVIVAAWREPAGRKG